MKKLLSLIIASTLCLGACAPQVSAEFKLAIHQVENELELVINWNGTEIDRDLIKLYRDLRESDLVSREINGELVARNAAYGDPLNTVYVPATVVLHVKDAHIQGEPGELKLNTGDKSFVPEGCECASVGMIAMHCLDVLNFSKDDADDVDQDFWQWVLRSW
jgi:hypothetical protein